MRTTLLSLAVALSSTAAFAHAATLASPAEVRDLTDRAVACAGLGRIDEAYSILAPYSLADVSSFDRARVGARSTRLQLEQVIGASVGFEFIRSETVGQSLLKLTYIEKTEKQAVPWEFIFYKTPAGWALSTLSNGDDVNTLFDR